MKRPWAFICASEGATSKHLRNYCREVYLLGYLPICPKLQDSQYLVLEDAVERSEYTAIVRDMPLGMLVTLDAIYNRVIQNWKKGRRTWIFCDEFYRARRSVT